MAFVYIYFGRSINTNVYAVSLDFSKAFDVVKYDFLFNSLMERNICPLIIRLVWNLYCNAKYCIKWNGESTLPFSIANGVKQGGVTLAFLFTVVIDALILSVKNLKTGCYIGQICACIFVYADDVILLAPSRNAAQRLLYECIRFNRKSGMKFNIGKCKFMIFGEHPNEIENLRIGIDKLELVDSIKHIGHELNNRGDLINLECIKRQIPEKTNGINRSFRMLYASSKSELFFSQCCSLYGVELIDIMSKQFNEIQVQWRKSIRHLINLHPRTHNDLLPHVIGAPNAKSIIFSRILCFAKKGLNHSNGYIRFFFRNCFTNMHSYMSRNINIIMRSIGVTYGDMLVKSESWIKRRCKSTPDPDWRARIVCELIQCREGSMQCGLAPDEINEILTNLCIE